MKSVLFFATAAAAAGPYLAWTADSFTKHEIDNKKPYHYTKAVLYDGFEAAIELTKDDALVDWYRSRIDDLVVQSNGSILNWKPTTYSLDEYRIGNNILWWYERTGEEKYKTAARTIRDQLVERHPRTDEGGFFHRSPDYDYQMWLDGIFMADTFYAKWTSLFDKDNTTAWNDIVNQFEVIDKHTRNYTTGLLYHGFDEKMEAVWANQITGASPLTWSRAVGWYAVALLEVLELLPRGHPGVTTLSRFFVTLAEGLKNAQDSTTGGWWLIMDSPYVGRPKNYIESSASALFVFSWLKGIRLGLLPERRFFPAAAKGYQELTTFVVENANGTVNWNGTVEVGSLKSNASFEYYTSVPIAMNDYKGVGPWMFASYEWETFNQTSAGGGSRPRGPGRGGPRGGPRGPRGPRTFNRRYHF
ncbi:glycosyl hydrolase family 88 [Colletotrichum paranaense]|uniref:Glycosyl hydrolase family 88 n=6 Tax=Colletotrichum acutatum species complex TaxID=2707335 RepID=A0A9Q0B1A3_9PEZI|nr:glycosyl hydrolase family 88 [Colletotrichum lupini]XP_060319763.1 glycosyl hydrolase family 88 [Colletotrichum costaricense]XP_060348375.1 glycosyl hydrolase family 88 [Colletotrichum paranaense]XP_060373642.1 glycosyl hydrolase family 88 [Colletotrichum tamarilloi]XP_060404179.1 glycosyl hydrolase family 88 [Colletotrichum abscissum]KAI3542726.1 glycosyl hydrolase family 88 [Colletotrichum filicis]KAK1453173.1 glycosyl hydrolase family 88 [Colletotrichum melonis]KAI3539652.1 glycosyl hy